jgi:hypothetical protein
VKDAPVRELERDGARFAVFELDPRATIACHAIGSAAPLASGMFSDQETFGLGSVAPAFAIGVGAFGGSADECRTRFGELLSVAGATAYQPGDGTNVPDYLIGGGAMASDVRLLYGLSGTGTFSHLVRFETEPRGATIGLTRLVEACLAATSAPSIGIVIVAEAAGLVGATLRRSPVERIAGGDFFAHPAVRTRLAFTAEPAFVRGVAIAAGIVRARPSGEAAADDIAAQLRPIGERCLGHLHAAAFRFRPIRKGAIEFAETVTSLFESEPLLGVLHLLHDDRGAAGAGESEFVRGACWIAPTVT